MSLFKKALSLVVPPPETEVEVRPDVRTIQKVEVPTHQPQQPPIEDTSLDSLLDELDSVEDTPRGIDIELSLFAQELQRALDKYAWVDKKRFMKPQIFLEDTRKNADGISRYYFYYDNNIVKPSDFIRTVNKDNSEIILNLSAVLQTDAIAISFVREGVAVVELQRGGL